MKDWSHFAGTVLLGAARTNVLPRKLLVALALLQMGQAQAVVLCVSTSAELQQARAAVGNNKQDDAIRLTPGATTRLPPGAAGGSAGNVRSAILCKRHESYPELSYLILL
jgi:hypothetical protein